MKTQRIAHVLAIGALWLGFASGCAIAQSQPAAVATVAQQHRGDVVVVRGFMGYWPGCGRMKAQLRENGYRPWVYPTAMPSILAHQISERRKNGTMQGELCLVGYSMGADQVIATARHLEHQGVKVDRLVLFEATLPGKIPANVQYCFNLFESRPLTDWLPVFRGVSVEAQSEATALVNYNVADQNPTLVGSNHFTMATHEHAQRVAISQIIRR